MDTNPTTSITRQARLEEVARRTRAGESERTIAHALGVSRTTVWTDKQIVRAGRGERTDK